MRPFRKVWVWAVSVLVVLLVLGSLPPVRIEYHKARLQGAKAKKQRLLGARLSGLDKLWLQVTGKPPSGTELDAAIQWHEDALVNLGFLQRERFVADSKVEGSAASEVADILHNACPWCHLSIVSDTNLILIASPQAMAKWRQRAHELGWKMGGDS